MRIEAADVLAMDNAAIAALAERLESIGSETKRKTPYTVREAAEALRVSTSHLREMIQAGTVARVPSISAIRIPAGEVERMREAKFSEEEKRSRRVGLATGPGGSATNQKLAL